MDQIRHSYVHIREVKLHIAETGNGSSAVVFIHGFPEIWYSWRHQMLAAAKTGYRAIAPDLRGYGLSQPHPDPNNASFDDFAEDTIAILDHFKIDKAFLVGKDFGSWPVYLISLLHKTRVCGVVSLGVPFFVPRPQRFKEEMPEGAYINRWKQAGRAEADFGRFDPKTVWKNIYILFSRSEIPTAGKDEEIMDLVDPSTSLPPWLSPDDVAVYASSYQNSGFDSPMQVPYKGLPDEFKLRNPRVTVPVLLIMGEKDYFLKFPGIKEYLESGEVNKYVSDLETERLAEGTHFMQEQFPEQVNQLIIRFLQKHI